MQGCMIKLNQLSGRYLSLPVQYQRAHPALKEEVDLAVLVRGGLTLLQTLIFSQNVQFQVDLQHEQR